ncbi:MAG: ATP-binding protein [Alphaproteobacteria bacterium PA3]|nr:MAG: ATP-binding protein [Alphaproteobacteria bacterium PA3]
MASFLSSPSTARAFGCPWRKTCDVTGSANRKTNQPSIQRVAIRWNFNKVSKLPAHKQQIFFERFCDKQASRLQGYWPFWARRSQLPPTQGWRTWLILGGRGSGKTRTAAEWVRERMESAVCSRMALIGPTFADVRDVMVEGQSGLQAIASPRDRPRFEVSRRRLVWPNGGYALLFSAEDPDSLRGPQFDGAWGDEMAAWSKPDAVFATLRPALRLGQEPQMVLSTTPRPIPALKQLLADPTCVITRSATRDNHHFLSRGFAEDLAARWQGSVWARQELEGELVEDPEGALWTRAQVASAQARQMDVAFDRVVVAVDPPVSAGAGADYCGIIVAAAGGEGHQRRAIVLADLSRQGLQPAEWAAVVAEAYRHFNANVIVAEANQGGEMVRTVLRLAVPLAPIRLVHASHGKRARAEPIALLYAQDRVCHAAHFRELEDQMCSFGAAGFSGSPDRVDALVWALTDLILDQGPSPSARSL